MIQYINNSRIQPIGRSFFVLSAVLSLILSGVSPLYSQQYMQPDGSISSSQNGLPSLPGDYPSDSDVPDPVYPPGIAPEGGLSTNPTQINNAPELLNMPSATGGAGTNAALYNPNSLLPSAAASAAGEQSEISGLFNAPGENTSAALHEGQLISDVKIEGNRQYSFERILPYLKTRPGRPFSKQVLENDVRGLIRSRMFTNVETLFKEVQDGNTVTVEVKFRVSERRVIQYIRYVGNEKIRKTTLEKEAYLKVGGAVDPAEVGAARERLESFYRSKGFARASVSVIQGLQLSDPGVIFQINEGPKQKIHWTSFEGNTIASDSRLRTQIQSKHGFLWIFSGELDYEKIEADIKILEDYYKNLGYLDVRIGREVRFNEKEDWADVIFYVHEGPRYKIRNIVVVGATKFSNEQLAELMEVQQGDFLNKTKLSVGVRKIQGKYGCIGHVFADVKPDVRYLETPGECDLVLGIKEGDIYRVGRVNILIAGEYPRTQIDTVLNRMTVKPGDIMDTTKIKASERRLKASQLFASDPQKGVSPSIVYSPPEIRDMEKQEGERMATPVQRPENSHSFRGQNPSEDYRHVVQFTPQNPAKPGEKTLDVTYYGTWQELGGGNSADAHWRSVEFAPVENATEAAGKKSRSNNQPNSQINQNSGLPTVPLSGFQPEAQRYNATAINYKYELCAARFAEESNQENSTVEFRGQNYASFAEYNQSSAQQYIEQEEERQETRARFLGQSGANQTQYNIDPFGAPSVPQTRSEVNQTLYQATPQSNSIQQTLYSQPPAVPQGTQSVSAASASKGALPSGGWTGANDSSVTPTSFNQALPPSPAASQLAPYSGGVGQNAYQDNLQIQPGIPGPNSPTGQSGGPFPATQPYDQTFSGLGTLPPVDDRNMLPIGTVLEETTTGRMMFSLGISSESGLLGSVVIDEQNFDWRRWPRTWRDYANGTAFRGRGEHLRLEASPGTSVQRYSISFGEPYLFNTNLSWDISGVYYERFYNEWSESRLGGQTSLGYHFHKDLIGYLSMKAYNVKLFDPVQPTPSELTDALGTNSMYGFSARLVYDKRDSPYMPTEGWYMGAEVEQVIGTYQYPRASFSLKKFTTLHERPDGSGRHVLSLKATLDWTDADTPIYDHYFTGGFSTIRGFRYRNATLREGGVVVGGHTQVLACAEYMFPITADDMVKGVVFCDTGTSDNNFGSWQDTYRVSVGAGLRITIPWMGSVPIALDFAVPVSKTWYDETEVFTFAMGTTF